MTEGQRRNSRRGWLGLIGKFPLLRSWGGGNSDGEPNAENMDLSSRKKSVISVSRKRKSDCIIGEGDMENVYVDEHGLRKPSFQMPLDASPSARRESMKASTAVGTVTKGSGDRRVEMGGEEDERNMKKKLKVMQGVEERYSGLPPSSTRNDGNPTTMDLQKLVELGGGRDQVLGLLEKAVVAVPDAQDDDVRAYSDSNVSSGSSFRGAWMAAGLPAAQPTPQVPTSLHQDVYSTPVAMSVARRQQHGHNNITAAAANDSRPHYDSVSGIVRRGNVHTTTTPGGGLKSTKRLVGIGGGGLSGPERRTSIQSSARAARRILESLEDMTSPVQGVENLRQPLHYTDSIFRDSIRRGGGDLSASPSKSCDPPRGSPPPLKSITSESMLQSGSPDTRLVVVRGRQNDSKDRIPQQQLPQEAVAEIPRMKMSPEVRFPVWGLYQPLHFPSYTPARVTSRKVQASLSPSAAVMTVVDNTSSPSSYPTLERWQPPPKRQRATMVREQQTQTEDVDETWDVRKASLRGGGVRHLTMGGGKLLLSQSSLSREKEDHGDSKPKRKEAGIPALSSRHPASAGHFTLSEENEGEDNLDDTVLAEEQHKNDVDGGEFVFTAPKAVVAPALDLCERRTSLEGSGVEAPKFSFSSPLESRHLPQSNEANSFGMNDNKLPFSFDQIKGSNLKKSKNVDAPFEERISPPLASQNDSSTNRADLQDEKKKMDTTSSVKGFDTSLFRLKPGQWKCSSCLVVNSASSTKCLACDVPKPPAAAGVETEAPPPVVSSTPSLPSLPSPPLDALSTNAKLPTSPVKNKPFHFELPPGGVLRKVGDVGLSAVKEEKQKALGVNLPATENAPSSTYEADQPKSETMTTKKRPFTFGGGAADAPAASSFNSKPLSATAEIFTPSTLGQTGGSSSVDPVPSPSTGAVNPVEMTATTSKTVFPSGGGGGFMFGSAASTTEAVTKQQPSNSSLSSASDLAFYSPPILPTSSPGNKTNSKPTAAAGPPSHTGFSAAAAAVVTPATPAVTVPESASGVVKPPIFMFGAAAGGSSAPTMSTGSSSPTKLSTTTPTFTFGAAAPAEKTTESSAAAKIQSEGKREDKNIGPAIGKPAFTFGATPAPAADPMPPAPSSLPSPPGGVQPKSAFSFNTQGHVSSPPAFGGASTISSAPNSPFVSAPSAISPQPGAGQAFTFNAAAGGGGGGASGVPSQNVTPMSHAAPSFMFGSTTDSQVQQQQQQQQPGFTFGAGSKVGGHSGVAFGQSQPPSSPPSGSDGQFGGFGVKNGGGFPIPQQQQQQQQLQQQQQQAAPVSFGGFSSQQAAAPRVGGIQQPGPSFGTPIGFGTGAAGSAVSQQQQGVFSMGVGASHAAKGGGGRGGRKFLRGKRRIGK